MAYTPTSPGGPNAPTGSLPSDFDPSKVVIESSGPHMGQQAPETATPVPQAWTAANQAFVENLRNQLGSATEWDRIRKEGQLQVMNQAGAMSRKLQTGASRGGVAGRGAGTGALRAPAQQALVGGIRGVASDVERMKGERMTQVASASLSLTQQQLSMMGYDANVINMALSMKEKALAQVAHRLGDHTFAATLRYAEEQFQKDIASGMPPADAGSRYYAAVTMGSTV